MNTGSYSKLAIIGVPGPLTAWLHVVSRAIYQQIHDQDFEEITVDDDESTEKFLARGGTGSILIVSHYPRRDLLKRLEENDIPTLVAVESAAACVMHQVAITGQNHLEATRPITQSLSLIAAAANHDDTAKIFDTHLEVSTYEFVAWLTRFLLLCREDQSHGLSNTIIASLGLDGLETLATSVARLQPPTSDPASKASLQHKGDQAPQIVRDVTEGMVKYIRGDQNIQVKWAVDFFYDGNNFTTPAPLIMDISGPARCLYYGPFLHLPEGLWEGEFFFGLSLGAIDTQLRIEVYTDKIENSYLAQARDAGIFVMPIALDITDARQPIQLRLFIDRGEIEGKIGLAYAILSPATQLLRTYRGEQ